MGSAQKTGTITLQYPKYDYTPVLGWSISRYEVFDKCKRQYYYQYYGKFDTSVPRYKIDQLKSLTSVPLEIGNVVHDVMEAFLRRLQKSDSDINWDRFFEFAETKSREYFSTKTFMECYYTNGTQVSMQDALQRIRQCLQNFISSPVYNWIFMKALTHKENWMIEPPGYGETRLNSTKAYCKMDFLFPVDNEVVILDWKTGRQDTYKHSQQLIGYAAAASHNFNIPFRQIYPKIIYLYPEFKELEVSLKESELEALFEKVESQTHAMQAYCTDVEKNIPKEKDAFPMSPSEQICRHCNFQELCFPDRTKSGASKGIPD